jgi:hypothetical protein
VRLRDVARIEVGAERYEFVVRYNGSPAAGLGIKLATGANALEAADAVKAKVAELSAFFPQGLEFTYPYDSTPYVKLSIEGVVETLVEAIGLVFLVMCCSCRISGDADPDDRGAGRPLGPLGVLRRSVLPSTPDHVRHGSGHRPLLVETPSWWSRTSSA